ncbi:exported protein of unknown function [Burkholderia multivorans]
MPWMARKIALFSPNAAAASNSLVMRTGTPGWTRSAPGVYVSAIPTTDDDGTGPSRAPCSDLHPTSTRFQTGRRSLTRFAFLRPNAKSPEGFRTQGFRIHFVGTNAPTRPNGLHYLFLCPERFARLTRGASEYPVTQ